MPDTRREALSLREGLGLVALLFLLVPLFLMPFQKAHPAWGLGLLMWGGLGLLPVLFAWWRGLSLRHTFRLRPASTRALFGACCLACGALPLVSVSTEWLHRRLVPDWEQFVSQMNQAVTPETMGVSLGGMLLLLAVSPAICEELFFRGLVLSSMQSRLRGWSAIVVTALLFAVFHMHPYRLFPTFVLGLLLGWLCLRTGSLFPGILAHATNNAIAIVGASLYQWNTRHAGAWHETWGMWEGLFQMTWQMELLLWLGWLQGQKGMLVAGLVALFGWALVWSATRSATQRGLIK